MPAYWGPECPGGIDSCGGGGGEHVSHSSSTFERRIREVRMGQAGPACLSPSPFTVPNAATTTMWAIGCDAVRSAYETTPTQAEKASVARYAAAVLNETERAACGEQDDGQHEGLTIRGHARTRQGLQSQWQVRRAVAAILLSSSRQVAARPTREFMWLSKPALTRAAHTLADMLWWTWMESGVIRFSCTTAGARLSIDTQQSCTQGVSRTRVRFTRHPSALK